MELFDEKKLNRIGIHLRKKKETISVAESVTSGLLQFAFSNVPDAAQFFQGGITAYNLAQKFRHLHVEPLHAQSTDCVSRKVATEMARQVCQLFSSEWGIGITGYASAVPQAQHKIFAYYAIVYKNKLKASGKLTHKKEDPPDVQRKYVDDVVGKLVGLMK